MKYGDCWAGALVAAIGAVAAYLSWPLELWSEFGPGPGFFPILLGTGLIAMGAAVGLAVPLQRTPKPPTTALRKPIVIAGIMAVYLALLEPLGFPLATTAFLFTVIHWVEARSAWLSLALAAGVTAALHLVFGTLLQTPLPSGMLAWTF
jgi:hypothetical protein